MISGSSRARPLVITGLIILFMVGICASFLSAVSLLFPGSFLEPIWRLNPNAHAGFERIGFWAPVLMMCVCLACILAALGLWRGQRWGYWLAVVMLIVNLSGDVINVITGAEPKAAAGIPIVAILLAYLLSKRIRHHFSDTTS